MDRTPLVTFSHLKWDSVYQRPHHVMSRLAGWREVLFVEEPSMREGEPELEIRSVGPGIRVCRPWLPVPGPGFGIHQESMLTDLLSDQLLIEGWPRFAAWLYTPMAVRIAKALGPLGLLYDCVDELSAFRHAPPELIEREKELLKTADAVFTGGPSLYRAKRDRHPFVRCFPSSVDAIHFGRAATSDDPMDQAHLPHPRLGFFGVIDERMDLDILETVADARPDWQIVLVGPVAKIDPAILPRRSNLHYLGQRDYRDLPAYVGGWDLCLMPFAINHSTRFISPTKVLEYMAAARPIVTTPIVDVVEPYGEIVYAGDDARSFLEACEQALAESPEDRQRRETAAAGVLKRTSWDVTARRMNEIVHYLVDPARERADQIPSAYAWPREATV